MKIIHTKSKAAILILAATAIPAFGQFRGHGSDRSASARPQFEQQRSFQAPAEQHLQRGESFPNGLAPRFEQRSSLGINSGSSPQSQPSYRQVSVSANSFKVMTFSSALFVAPKLAY